MTTACTQGAHHIGLAVRDVAEARDFFVEALGFHVAAERPDYPAIFVTDVLAFGAAQACQQQGIAVPGRLALAGLGDFELARAAHPPLTTVRIPGEQIGRTAATMIADLLSGDPDRVAAVPQVVDLGCEIVFRSSA